MVLPTDVKVFFFKVFFKNFLIGFPHHPYTYFVNER